MGKKRETILGVMISLVLANPVWGHVALIYPKGGETFYFREKVKIEWHITMEHNDQENFDLYFSPDGGANWVVIDLDLDPGYTTYSWPVPELETDQARIWIYMDNEGTDYDDTSDDFAIQDAQASVHVPGELPLAPELHANYPNPFNPVTTLRYDLPERANVELTIFDILGRQVRTLVQVMEEPGYKSVVWDGANDFGQQVSAGVYLYRIQAGDFTQTRKMLLIK